MIDTRDGAALDNKERKCSNNCEECAVASFCVASSVEKVVAKTSAEENYNFSRKCLIDLADSITLSRERQKRLLDELCEERATEKSLESTYKRHQETVRRYEFYKEIERERKNG